MASGSPSDSPSKSPSPGSGSGPGPGPWPSVFSSAQGQSHTRRGSRTSRSRSNSISVSNTNVVNVNTNTNTKIQTTRNTPPPPSDSIPQTLWGLHIPLHITHVSQPTAPFITSVPRFGYLALLLPRLSTYYGTPCSSFHHEGVQLRNLAVGLLVDLYEPSLPWKLVVGDGPEWDIGDTFMNSAKEADFVRNGNAKQIMSLSKDHTTALWNAVQDNDYTSFTRINNHLLNAPTALKNIPLRIYIPSSPPNASVDSSPGSFKVMQTLVQPRLPNRTSQTLGVALRAILPTLFPSSRDPVLANVVLHGSPVPFNAPLEELMREAAYPDGWLALVVVLL